MNQKKSNFEQFHSFRSPPNCNPLKTNLVYLYFDPELNIAKKNPKKVSFDDLMNEKSMQLF